MARFRGWKEFLSGPTRTELGALIFTLLAAAFLAFVILVAFPLIWAGVKELSVWLDWKLVVLALVLIFYVYSSIDLWYKNAQYFREPYPENWFGRRKPLWRREIGGFFAGFVLSIDQALSTFHRLVGPIFRGLGKSVSKRLHPSFQKILARSTGIFVLIWLSTYAILLFANLWPQEQQACAWKFPKILSCLLTQYENLSAGLIGAGGAIFAGWLAWTAVQIQIAGESEETPEPDPTPREPMTEEEARAEGRRLAEVVLARGKAEAAPDTPSKSKTKRTRRSGRPARGQGV